MRPRRARHARRRSVYAVASRRPVASILLVTAIGMLAAKALLYVFNYKVVAAILFAIALVFALTMLAQIIGSYRSPTREQPPRDDEGQNT